MEGWYDERREAQARAYDRAQAVLFLLRFVLLFALAALFWLTGWSRALAEGLRGRMEFPFAWPLVYSAFTALAVFGYEAVLFPLSVLADYSLERAHGRLDVEFGAWLRGYLLTLLLEIGIVTAGFTGLVVLMRVFPAGWWLAAALFLLKLDFSRSFITLFCVLLVLMLSAERYVVLWVLRYFRQRGYNYRNLVICGTGEQAVKIAVQINAKPELGLRVRCFADLRERSEISGDELSEFRARLKGQAANRSARIIVGLRALEKALKEYAIDEVVFTDIIEVMPRVEEAILMCAEQGVRTTLAADLFSIGLVKSGISYFEGMPLIHFQTPPGDRWELMIKRAIDIAVSAVLLVLFAPLLALIAALATFLA